MNDRDRLYLRHILDCIAKIESYTARGSNVFFEQDIVQDAVVRNLQLIGESSKRTTDETRGAAAEVPWRAVVGLRNVLVHDYLGVDLDGVWRIVEDDLPDLKRAIETLLASGPTS